ncbi:MAG: hypothetical protein L0241_09235 [Planctomycetia bacterium]|nr:hypothetical protein [Planctomycetia bacterium]
MKKADDATIQHLAPLTRLRRLYLGGTKVTGRGLEIFPLLTHLHLVDTQTDNKGMASIASLPRLQNLNLFDTRITGSALPHVSGLRWLEEFCAWATPIRDKDLVHLEGLKNLNWVYLYNTHVTKKGINALQKKLKKATIKW